VSQLVEKVCKALSRLRTQKSSMIDWQIR
jgi:hypothetical protein